MQAIVSSEGTAGSYALLFLVKHQAENGGLVRHFVCSECLGMVAAVQGRDYLHTCDGGRYADLRAVPTHRAASTA
jgi:hypothetical protein